MFSHYLKFFIRNLIRQKGYTFINIAGLSVGMAISILILLFVFNEISYDRHIHNLSNKYRLNSIMEYPGGSFDGARSNGEISPYAIENIPEVINAVSLYDEFPFIRYKDKGFTEDQRDFYFAQQGVFDFFNIEFLEGDPEQVFNEPYSIVLSEKIAQKYFGDEDPIGKVLSYNDRIELKVTGIFKSLPEASHRKINMLAPMEALMEMQGLTNLKPFGNSFLTYVEVNENVQLDELCRKLETFTYSLVPEKLKESMDVKLTHYLQPVKDIYLYTDFNDEEEGGKVVYVYIFTAVALFILLLACINFMTLSTARYANRAKEVGLRKIIGAGKGVLIRQFLGESVFLSIIALFTAIVLAELFLPTFNLLIDKNLKFII